VVDADTQEAVDRIEALLPDGFQTPVATTPRGGRHYYFRHADGYPNRANVFPGCDIRTTGGYVVAPPGTNGTGGSYAWVPGLALGEVQPAELPPALAGALQEYKKTFAHIGGGPENPNATETPQNATNGTIGFGQGERDQALFHVANCLVKGGMSPGNILKTILFLSSHCSPPFPEKEAQTKVESALKRTSARDRNIAEEVREWVQTAQNDTIRTQECHKELCLAQRDQMKAAREEFRRLVQKGVLEPTGRNGVFRKPDRECEAMNLLEAPVESVPLWLPFNIHRMVEIMPGNIIVLAGEPNSGKTGLMLNIVHQNMGRHQVHYFNSEMGASELRKRLELFPNTALGEWHFNAYERSGGFADVVKPGPGNLNVIDYLEIHDDFYKVGGELDAIHRKLAGALAIVALQKNKGTDTGLGGFRGLEKPRLYLAVSPGRIKIVKAKNWRDPKCNPNGLEIAFTLAAGCVLRSRGEWGRPNA
jgi:hypothetical protein